MNLEPAASEKLSKLCVIVTRTDALPVTLAFSIALTAVGVGNEAIIYLMGDAVIWGSQGTSQQVYVPPFPTLDELIEDFCSNGGKVYICSSCIQACRQKGETIPTPKKNVEVAGFSVLVSFIQQKDVKCITI